MTKIKVIRSGPFINFLVNGGGHLFNDYFFCNKKSLFVFCHCLVSITPHPCSRILIFAHIFWILFDDFHTWVHSKGEHEGGVGWGGVEVQRRAPS